MTAEPLDRKEIKWRVRETLETAHVSPKRFTALYLGLGILLNWAAWLGGGEKFTALVNSVLNGYGAANLSGGMVAALFISVLTSLLSLVLDAGFVLYCMSVRRGEEAEYRVLFDGFGLIGKLILLEIVKSLFIFLWALLLVIPGIVASYRYRFALFNLLENPELGVMETLAMSKGQSWGYKAQLFLLDLSYLGWGILAGLPGTIYQRVIQGRLQSMAFSAYSGGGVPDFLAIQQSVPTDFLGLPGPVWELLLIPVWALAVSLFYLPNYQCVELEYFEAAKRSSGIGADAPFWGQDDTFEGTSL